MRQVAQRSFSFPGQRRRWGGERARAVLNQDVFTDLVTVSRATNEVFVFLESHGLLQSPVSYASGASEPLAVAVGSFIGQKFPDLAVGDVDGSLTFLEGDGTSETGPT